MWTLPVRMSYLASFASMQFQSSMRKDQSYHHLSFMVTQYMEFTQENESNDPQEFERRIQGANFTGAQKILLEIFCDPLPSAQFMNPCDPVTWPKIRSLRGPVTRDVNEWSELYSSWLVLVGWVQVGHQVQGKCNTNSSFLWQYTYSQYTYSYSATNQGIQQGWG